MGFRSPLVLMSTIGLCTLGLLASPDANKAVADPGGDRLGCGTFCQSAGGYGAAGNAPRPPQAVTLENTGTAIADADGYVPVTLKCHRAVQCKGKLQLGVDNVGGGRSNLLVNAGTTRTIGVPMDAATIAYLRSHGPTQGHLLIDASPQDLNAQPDWRDLYNDGLASISLSNPLTMAAPG